MNPERRPLLMDAEVQGRCSRPRPDIRNSPETALVDVKSEDEGNSLFFTSIVHINFILLFRLKFQKLHAGKQRGYMLHFLQILVQTN